MERISSGYNGGTSFLSRPAMDRPGPYQSRLFNLINRQWIQWGDRLGQQWRQVKTALVWGVQIAIYPFYLITQSVRLAGKQMNAAASGDKAPRLTAGEGTIATILAQAQTLQPELSPPPRAIASLWPDQRLVWIDGNNQILGDPLPPDRQQALQDYLQQQLARPPVAVVLPLPPAQDAPPLGWLNRLLGWMQTGTLAQTIDLFGESRLGSPLVLPPAVPRPLPWVPPLPTAALWQQMDRQIAQWEANTTPVPGGDRGDLSPDPIPPSLTSWWQRLGFMGLGRSVAKPVSPDAESRIPRAIPTLPKPRRPDLQDVQPAGPLALTRQVIAVPSLGELPMDLCSQERVIPLPTVPTASPLSTMAPPPPKPTHRPRRSPADLSQSQPGEGSDPWIEAQVTGKEYVRHPLETLLHGLDRLILWCEEQWLRFWRWCQRRG